MMEMEVIFPPGEISFPILIHPVKKAPFTITYYHNGSSLLVEFVY